jgi:hypothetical protein
MDGIGGYAGSVGHIAALSQAMSSTKLKGEVATTLLKQSLDMQKEMAAQLMQSMGVGVHVDTQA